MRKTIFSRLTTIGLCAVFLLVAFGSHALAQSGGSGNVRTSITKVNVFGSTAGITQAGASLSTNNEAVFANISTSGLPAGEVVTLWWVFFNNSSQCVTPGCSPSDLNNPNVNGSLQYGGGAIVSAGRRADFSGYFGLGDNTGFYLLPQFPNMPNPAPGLLKAKEAVIHLVIRKHGPASADPAILEQQLTTFPGGCSVMPNPCANIQAALFIP
jgi:hypothetical protein